MTMTSTVFRITGMDCADCARTIERGVAKLPGVEACTLNFGSAQLKVQGAVAHDAVVERVQALGYGVRSNNAREGAPPENAFQKALQRLPQSGVAGFVRFLLSRSNTLLAALGALLILPGLIFEELMPFLGVEGAWLDATSLAALALAGWPILKSAWRTLRVNREIGINALMVIAAIGAVVLGAYTEAGMVMVLFAIGEALEGYTADRARLSIRSLLEVAPAEATALRACVNCAEHLGRDGYTGGPCPFCGLEETRVFVDELQPGDVIVIKPGERIAMDGVIRKGASTVNEAAITGESMPAARSEGNTVFAGTVNGEGALEVEVTHRADDSTLSRIIHMVEDAQDGKAPAERFVDRFARIYTPAVVALAALVAAVPPLLLNAAFWGPDGWLYRALALLVVACPCALVISTPVALVSALARAARNGVLIKGGAYLEMLAGVKAIAFDKTGTLTEGKPSLVRTGTADCNSHTDAGCERCDDMLALASAVERRSEHPLAQAVVAGATQRRVQNRYAAAEETQSMPGRGVRGRVNGGEVVVGSHAFFDEALPHAPALCARVQAAAAEGITPLLVGHDGATLGYICVADSVRASSRDALRRLHDDGLEASVMLTGDAVEVAQRVAQDVGVREVRAGLLPGHKADAVKALVARYGKVAMVGDGINDAPALATASVGIAMGAGSGQALETADVALISNDLGQLPATLRLARAAMRTIRVNIAFAIAIKVVFIGLVLAGYGSLWMAVFADVGAALLVTLNGMRLLRWRSNS